MNRTTRELLKQARGELDRLELAFNGDTPDDLAAAKALLTLDSVVSKLGKAADRLEAQDEGNRKSERAAG